MPFFFLLYHPSFTVLNDFHYYFLHLPYHQFTAHILSFLSLNSSALSLDSAARVFFYLLNIIHLLQAYPSLFLTSTTCTMKGPMNVLTCKELISFLFIIWA